MSQIPNSTSSVTVRGVTYNINRHPKWVRRKLMQLSGKPRVASTNHDSGRLNKWEKHTSHFLASRFLRTP